MGKLVLTIGLIGLCHAAYSATQHRNYMRLTDAENLEDTGSTKITSLPMDIVIQTLISLLLCCAGLIGISTKFKQIKITSEWENKTWDNIGNRTSFWSFQHRGKTLFSAERSHLPGGETQQLGGGEFQLLNRPPKMMSDEERVKKLLLLEQQQKKENEILKAAYAEDGEEEDDESDEGDEELEGADNDDESSDDQNEQRN